MAEPGRNAAYDAFQDEGPWASPSEYIQSSLEDYVGGDGRFQYAYSLILSLAAIYSAVLAYISIFAGAAVDPEAVDCNLPRQPWGSARRELSYIADFELVCNRHFLAPLLVTLYWSGFMVAVPFWGAVSDRRGRKPATLWALAMALCGALASALSPGYWALAASRAVTGFGISGFGLAAYVWNAEVIGSGFRPVFMVCHSIIWSLGEALVSPLSWLLPRWRQLFLAATALGCVCFLLFPQLSESPQWLLVQGRGKEAHKVLCGIAQCNGRPAPPPPSGGALCGHEDAGPGPGICGLLDARLLPRLLAMCFAWFTVSMAFFGLSLNPVGLPLSAQWANIVSALSGIPSYLCAAGMIESPHCGRRGAVSSSLLVAGACLLLSTVGGQTWLTVLHYLAMSAVSLCFSVVYVHGSELFPTDVRGLSLGLMSLSARIGAMLAPFVADLGSGGKALSLFIFAVPCVAAGLVTLCLPETRGKALPGTVDDLNESSSEEPSVNSKESESE